MSRVIKRFIDIVAGVFLGIIAIPILLISMLIVFVVSPKSGSPIFKQTRIGYQCKPFVMLKLRTMTNTCDKSGELLSDEERLKWWGKVIRKTNIDELTQIIHIIAGQMSFVGPRPLLPKEMLVMTEEEQKKRQSVLPGIVGWESVNEEKSCTRYEMAQFDLYYVEQWSLKLDALIVLKTVISIFSFSRPDDTYRAPKLDEKEIEAAQSRKILGE